MEMDMPGIRLVKSLRLQEQVRMVCTAKKMAIAVLGGKVVLVNENLEVVRELGVGRGSVLSVGCSNKGFLVVCDTKAKLQSHPLVRFLRVTRIPQSIYY